MRRVNRTGQVLAMQVQHGRAAQALCGLLQARPVRVKLLPVKKNPDKSLGWRLRGKGVGEAQAVACKFNDLHVQRLFSSSRFKLINTK